MNSELSNKIKAEALSLGFSACGIARAEAVSRDVAEGFMSWLNHGGHATMAYMENHLEKRLDPRLLVPGTKSIVSVALNYAPAQRLPEGEYQIAAYALGKDYHDIVKNKLRQLAQVIIQYLTPHQLPRGGESDGASLKASTREDLEGRAPKSVLDGDSYRVFSDSAPVLERYWAVKAGLGWVGRNHQLIIPHAGSMFFLGELFLPIELEYDTPMESRCGNCHNCIDACPTGALTPHQLPRGGEQEASTRGGLEGVFNCSKCLSYLTIENRGEIPDDMAEAMGDTIYGCDRCQQACPWNRFAHPTDDPLLQPSEELLAMTREQWQNLTEEDFRRLFKGSAVKRAKYEGLMRNINRVRS